MADHLEGFQQTLPAIEHGDMMGSSVDALPKTARCDQGASGVLAVKPAKLPAAAAVQNRRKGPSWWNRCLFGTFSVQRVAIWVSAA